MSEDQSETDALLSQAARGDQEAVTRLLATHRDRLRRMAMKLRQTLETLAPDQQEILSLHYIEGLTLAEAGVVLQITAQAARMRHLRAIKRLRDILDSDSGISRP